MLGRAERGMLGRAQAGVLGRAEATLCEGASPDVQACAQVLPGF
jgi:hypothetical protein